MTPRPADPRLDRARRWAERATGLLWSPALERHGRAVALAVRLVRLAWAVLRDLFAGHLGLRATGLVYVTILSVIPVVTLGFAVLKAFGVHRELQPVLATWLTPLGADGTRIAGAVVGFVERVQGNVLAGVGLVLLVATTLSLVQRVEASFNFVWRVDRPRSLARRLSDYLAVLLLVPVAMVAALALSATLANSAWLQALAQAPALAWVTGLWGRLAPYLLVCAAFAFVYWFVPNTRVRPGPALAGGLAGGIVWAATGALFARLVVNSTQQLSIYAGFAIAISALVWLHLCWLILLLGAQVAFYVQHPDYLRLGYRRHAPGGRDTESLALAVMLRVARAFAGGGPRPAAADLAEELRLPGIVLAPVLAQLEEAGLLTRSEHDELLPNRAPERILVRDVLVAVREPVRADPVLAVAWPAPVGALATRIGTAIDREFGAVTLADVAAPAPGAGGPGPV